MTDPSATFRERVREVALCIYKSRGNIIGEFAKVCPTANSFNVMQKNTHRVWDGVCGMLAELFHFVDDSASVDDWLNLLLNEVRPDKSR